MAMKEKRSKQLKYDIVKKLRFKGNQRDMDLKFSPIHFRPETIFCRAFSPAATVIKSTASQKAMAPPC